MLENVIAKCKYLIDKNEFTQCERMLAETMVEEPHSAIPHNLLGVLFEKENNHVLAMKHFRAAYGLDPTYIPARYNMEQFGNLSGSRKCAFSEDDCVISDDRQFTMKYDTHHIGYFIHKRRTVEEK